MIFTLSLHQAHCRSFWWGTGHPPRTSPVLLLPPCTLYLAPGNSTVLHCDKTEAILHKGSTPRSENVS